MSRIHVIDPDVRRRAIISRSFRTFKLHAEIYEDCAEFFRRPPPSGLLCVAHPEAVALLDRLPEGDLNYEVIVYAERPDTQTVVDMMRNGAADFFDYPFDWSRLRRSLADAAARQAANASVARKRSEARRAVGSLSQREMEVLRALIDGGSSKSIARALGISDRTVEIHRANLMRKLNAGSTSDAVRIGLYGGADSAFEVAA